MSTSATHLDCGCLGTNRFGGGTVWCEVHGWRDTWENSEPRDQESAEKMKNSDIEQDKEALLACSQSAAERVAHYPDNYKFSSLAKLSYHRMLSYCWGRRDARGSLEQMSMSDALRIAEQYRAMYEDFYQGYLTSTRLDSLVDFYENHVKHLTH